MNTLRQRLCGRCIGRRAKLCARRSVYVFMLTQMAQSMGKGNTKEDVGQGTSDKAKEQEGQKEQKQPNQNDQFQNLQQEILKQDKGKKTKLQDVEGEEEKTTK